MTKLFPTLAILALTACATAQPAGEPASAAATTAETLTADELLRRVEAKTADLDTLRAKVTHVVIQGLLGDEQRRFGTLLYDDADDASGDAAATPARFAIHFDRKAQNGQLVPEERGYIFDGRWLAEKLPAERIFIRREVVAEGDTSDPLALGEGPFAIPLQLKRDEVLRRFEVATIDEPDADVPAARGLRLVPKPGVDMDQTRIDLWFDAESLLPAKIETLEDDETTQIVYLREAEMNPSLDRDAFDTAAPGTDWQVEEHRLQP